MLRQTSPLTQRVSNLPKAITWIITLNFARGSAEAQWADRYYRMYDRHRSRLALEDEAWQERSAPHQASDLRRARWRVGAVRIYIYIYIDYYT